MKEYTVEWTHYLEHNEESGYTVIEAENEDDAAYKFYQIKPELNPFKKKFIGYVIEEIY